MKFRADVAQLVEQSIRNRQVIGSIPIVGSSTYNETPLLAGFSYLGLSSTKKQIITRERAF